MKYPKTIQIGAHEYSIAIINRPAVDCFKEHIGKQDYESLELEIGIMDRFTGGTFQQSVINALLWHEIVHAINHLFAVGLDEDKVDLMSQGITQVLKSMGIQIVEV